MLQCRLRVHQISPELLAAAELKLLVETSTQSDKNPFALLICHQGTTHSKRYYRIAHAEVAHPLQNLRQDINIPPHTRACGILSTAQYLACQCQLHTFILAARQVFGPVAEIRKEMVAAAGGLISDTNSQGSPSSWANKFP